MRGFTRISPRPIRLHCPIEQPDVIVVLDETLIGTSPIADGATDATMFLVNSAQSPADVR
jgi:pyruvate ferredoxin oxidoreductase gamma subunit